MSGPGPAPAGGTRPRLHVVVATVVHHPLDARIRRRQIEALLAAGHRVTYVAPWRATGTPLPSHPSSSTMPSEAGSAGPPEPGEAGSAGPPQPGEAGQLRGVDVPRAAGRRRLAALRAARAALARLAPSADVIMVHDPELLLALPRQRQRRPVLVWDVHEDTAAAVAMKAWLPQPLRAPAAGAVRAAERLAERRVHLLLAEESYRARFGHSHPVVPNLPVVPSQVQPPGGDRVVYVGMVSVQRGLLELIELGRRLAVDGVRVEIIGEPAGPEARALLAAAQQAGEVVWPGRLPNDEALARVDGALAGLSLLHDEPNYRHSLPTKVAEYLAHGVPVITTPVPLAAQMVADSGGGVVVPFGAARPAAAPANDAHGAPAAETVKAAVDAVRALKAKPELRQRLASSGHAWAREHADWTPHAEQFVATLESWARQP